jgi:hypothetical protein
MLLQLSFLHVLATKFGRSTEDQEDENEQKQSGMLSGRESRAFHL